MQGPLPYHPKRLFFLFAAAVVAAMDSIRARTGVDLNIRVGLSSGPITAGVIRANNRRFQCFGATMVRAGTSLH